MAKILVIEDEASIRENLMRFLRLEGHEVISAENGRSGLDLARTALPDMIFCDLMMPEMNGTEVLDALRADSGTAHIIFLFLTASADVEEVQRGLLRGANEYLTKPFNLKDLREAIGRHLVQGEGA